MGVDLEKKRKLLLYPIEYQRGCPCEWVLEFARVGVSRRLGRAFVSVPHCHVCGILQDMTEQNSQNI